jgi:hypothetical protein
VTTTKQPTTEDDRCRAYARSRALARLALLHPRKYRRMYREELAKARQERLAS